MVSITQSKHIELSKPSAPPESSMLTLILIAFFLIFSLLIVFYSKRLPPSPNSKFFENILIMHRVCGSNHFQQKCQENSLSSLDYAHIRGASGK